MEQKHNPNKNAELSMEQNYNQIDGIINNLPAPPSGISCSASTHLIISVCPVWKRTSG